MQWTWHQGHVTPDGPHDPADTVRLRGMFGYGRDDQYKGSLPAMQRQESHAREEDFGSAHRQGYEGRPDDCVQRRK